MKHLSHSHSLNNDTHCSIDGKDDNKELLQIVRSKSYKSPSDAFSRTSFSLDEMQKHETYSGEVAVHDAVSPPLSAVALEQVLRTIQERLLSGDRAEALATAEANHLWDHALVIASQINAATLNQTVGKFARATLRPESPLHAMYLVIGGEYRGALAATAGGGSSATEWRSRLASLLASGSSTDTTTALANAIGELGDQLWASGQPTAAHVCYLLARSPILPYNNPNSRVALLGANHKLRPLSGFVTPEAIQRTEIYELLKHMAHPKGASAAMAASNFVTFKLNYAYLLADMGLLNRATKYAQAIVSQQAQQDRIKGLAQELLFRITEHHRAIRPAHTSSWLGGGSNTGGTSHSHGAGGGDGGGSSWFGAVFGKVLNAIAEEDGPATPPPPSATAAASSAVATEIKQAPPATGASRQAPLHPHPSTQPQHPPQPYHPTPSMQPQQPQYTPQYPTSPFGVHQPAFGGGSGGSAFGSGGVAAPGIESAPTVDLFSAPPAPAAPSGGSGSSFDGSSWGAESSHGSTSTNEPSAYDDLGISNTKRQPSSTAAAQGSSSSAAPPSSSSSPSIQSSSSESGSGGTKKSGGGGGGGGGLLSSVLSMFSWGGKQAKMGVENQYEWNSKYNMYTPVVRCSRRMHTLPTVAITLTNQST